MTGTVTPRRMDGAQAPKKTGHPWLVVSPAVLIGIIAVVPVAALGALLVSLVLSPVYGAQTDVVFDLGGGLSDAAASRLLATQEVVLRSDAVLGPVSTATRIPVRDLDENLDVEVVGGSNVVRFTVASRNPESARRLAELISAEYEGTIGVATPASVRWSVLSPPHVLDEPLRPRPVQSAALGAVVGVFIAAIAAAVLIWPRLAIRDVVGISDL